MEARLRSFSTTPVASSRQPLLDRAFLEHPRSLGENYWQHQHVNQEIGFSNQAVMGAIRFRRPHIKSLLVSMLYKPSRSH
jgi:hypothetical protein